LATAGLGALALLSLAAVGARGQEPSPFDWPEIERDQRPWARWWWHGSAVEDLHLTSALEAYRAAGFGGLEITPIYGVAGYEDRFLDFLSPEWVERLDHTLAEASRLDLGVDMATGTGWPFGGPGVEAEDASRYVAHRMYVLRGGERLQEPVVLTQEPLLGMVGNRIQVPPDAAYHPLQDAGRSAIGLDDLVEPVSSNRNLQALALEQVRFPKPMPLEALVAYSDAGDVEILTDRVGPEGLLDWTAPAGEWTLYAVFQGWHGKMVERAGPGGEGYVIDHFSEEALHRYLAPFTEALGYASGLRGFFNDSYEVDDARGEADWTPRFFEEFEDRRGYDLRRYLPELFGDGDETTARRVLVDYRETMSDLLLDRFTIPWEAWAESRGALVRNQAHGSPANILDLYGASDIPETEGAETLRFKFATSAAHVTGKPLASAEAATWLDEHFVSNLSDVKAAVDGYLVGGVNHIVYHGTAYSPADAPWPGWLFYAAVHFQPTNPLWTDLGALNAYVARAQSILQRGHPDNDVLLYLPIWDRWADRGPSMLVHFDGIGPFEGMPVADDATLLVERGYGFDFISDRQLGATETVEGQVRTPGGDYPVIVVPGVRLMPPQTLEKLIELAEDGATVVMHARLPEDVPGLGDLDSAQAAFDNALDRLVLPDLAMVQIIDIGSGHIVMGNDLELLLGEVGVLRESLVDTGLEFVRRSREGGRDYFVSNRTTEPVDAWVPLATDLSAAVLFDPMTGETGLARARSAAGGGSQVRLQLGPGESVIVRSHETDLDGPSFGYYEEDGPAQTLAGRWRVEFREGGADLPAAFETTELGSWTELGGADAEAFSGTATYTLSFPRPAGGAEHWSLALGEVHESARVRLNGQDLVTLIGPTYEVVVDAGQLEGTNVLEVDVSNLMANRIAAMDRRGEPWKRFYNVNIRAFRGGNLGENDVFDASGWAPLPSGLIGPVTLTPLRAF